MLMKINYKKALLLFQLSRTSIYTLLEILVIMLMSLACQTLVAIGAHGGCCQE
jgi:hypothetical protein